MPSYPSKVNQKSKFRPTSAQWMDQLREVLQYHRYRRKTELAYVRWIKGFIYFYNKQHPKIMGKYELEASLCPLAVHGMWRHSHKTTLLTRYCFGRERHLILNHSSINMKFTHEAGGKINPTLLNSFVLRVGLSGQSH